MSKTRACLIGLAFCGAGFVGGAAAWMSGCSASVGPGPGGGVSVSFTIGGSNVTITLGPAGLFVVAPNTLVRNVASVQPFQRPPTDSPATGAVRLVSSSVTILPPGGGSSKWAVTAQPAINGTARLTVWIDAPGAVSPCDSGIELGTFEIVVASGIVTSIGPALPVALAAIDYFNRNDLSLCLEIEADFDAMIQIEGLDISFGPSQSGVSDGLRATFERRNLDTPPIHILPPGEDFGEANRIGIGAPQSAIIDGLDINGLVTFRAGRDAQVLDSVTCPPVRYSGFIAIVEWDGTDLRCYEPAPGPTTEACCLAPTQNYEDFGGTFAAEVFCGDIGVHPAFRSADDCRFFDGVPQGSGTTCATVACNEPWAACCFRDSCSELLFETCQRLGGVFQGSGRHCDSVSCEPTPPPDNVNDNVPLPDEACCFDDGTCQDGDPEVCDLSSGSPRGPGSRCTTASCPQPNAVGACCLLGSEQCNDDVREADCTGNFGGFLGAGTTCATSNCTIGACCDGQGGCLNTWKDFCENVLPGGEYQGSRADGIDCISLPCDGGVCCHGNNQCTLATPHDCTELSGEWVGGISCQPDSCRQADYVVWYTRSVCCWGAPLLYITDRAGFERTEYQCNFPGGGIDCSAVTTKAELMGGFESYEAAQAWICPQFVSRFSHAWCSQYYQMNGANWQPGGLGCDLSTVPITNTVPDVNGCQ